VELTDPSRDLIEQALARRPEAARQLVDRLYPAVQARVARVLCRAGRASGRSARQEVEDMIQDVFANLFEQDGRALRAWDPARGLPLEQFAALLAERHVVSVLRSGRRNPWTEDPTLDTTLERQGAPTASPEPALLSRELLGNLLDRLRMTLSPLGMHLFELIYVDQREVEEVAVMMKMTADAVYAWRSRLRKLVATLAAELSPNTPAPAAGPHEVSSHE
jgi:RNA polymerase sigma factor (sigma-70 family)